MLLSHPAFQLFSATLYETVEQGIMQSFLNKSKKEESFRKLDIGSNHLPVALRWSTHPEFGFPRQPFKVFRRLAHYSAEQIVYLVQGANEAVSFQRDFLFGEEMFVMAVTCTIPAGQSLILTPMGKDNIPMKAKSYKMESSGTIIFKAPFMKGLRCEGLGWVNTLAAFPMQIVMQSAEWEHIQTVGFPFKKGEVGGQGYDSDPQGFVGAMVSGEEAGLLRLKMGEWLFIPPNSVNAGDSLVPDVHWRHPGAEDYLKLLEDQQLKMVKNCLRRSDDLSYDRSERQISFMHKMTIPGIDQPGSGLPTKDANVVIPVVKHTVLTVSNESPAALGLGFGTYDFIPAGRAQGTPQTYSHVEPNMKMVAAQNYLGYDYMVTADYTIRPFDNFPMPFLDNLSKNVTFCALNDERTKPVTPSELIAMGIQMNRPEQIDAPYTESVKLRWEQSNVPHGYGIVSSYKNGLSVISNDGYEFGGNSYQSFFTPIPKIDAVQQDNEDVGKFVYIGTDEPVPFYGSEAHKYFIAGWDVFGRWTPWKRCGYIATAPAPQQPGIMSISLNIADPDNMHLLSPTEPEVDCTMVIEFGWDWIDRTPSEIQIAGRFFDAALTNAPTSVPANFATRSTGANPPVISIKFTSTDPNALPTTNLGSITIVQSQAPDPADGYVAPKFGSSDIPSANLKRYRLVITNFKAHFTGLAPYKVAYSAFIRGLERVRVSAPNGWSNWESGYNTLPDGTVVREGGYITKLADPRPPAVVNIPATVNYTAVPDAAKIARGRLSWPAATGALTYTLWEASETAIRVALEDRLKTDSSNPDNWLKPLSAPIVERATQLRDLLLNETYKNLCQRSFSRLSKEPVATTHYELALPGSSDGLYLYRISSVNSANIESAKSGVAFFAVPKVVTPAAPMLQVRPYKKKNEDNTTEEGIEVKVVHTTGEEPAGYQLYRTRKRVLSNDPGMKGAPVLEHDAPEWMDTTINMLDGTFYAGKKITESTLTRSWRPLVYQAVAVGKADAQRGRISGESEGSTTEIAYFPPDTPPTLVNVSSSGNAQSKIVTMTTNAPFDKVDLGKTFIEVYAIGSDDKRTLLKSFIANETVRTNAALVAPTAAADLAQLPKMQHQAPNLGTGITTFSVCIALASGAVILRIIDPLNRASEIRIEA